MFDHMHGEVARSCLALVGADKYDAVTSSATSTITIRNNGRNEGARCHRRISRSQQFERTIASASIAAPVAGTIVSEGTSDV